MLCDTVRFGKQAAAILSATILNCELRSVFVCVSNWPPPLSFHAVISEPMRDSRADLFDFVFIYLFICIPACVDDPLSQSVFTKRLNRTQSERSYQIEVLVSQLQLTCDIMLCPRMS